MARLLEIPDILCLICEEVPRSDLAKLLATSRLFFDCAAPIVWRNLPETAPLILMRLLPGIDPRSRHNLKPKHINRLQPLEVQSFVRFNIYAPYVRQLAQGLGLNQIWKKLFKLIDTRPILPNLQVLKVSISGSGQDPLSYITAYLSPSLTEIDYVREAYPFVEPRHVSNFLSSIAQHCPGIRTLNLGYAACSIAMGSFYGEELASSLCKLHNLRVLGLGPVTLDLMTLMALGSLPNLESLTLNELPYPKWLTSATRLRRVNTSLPLDSFSNLQHLGIDPCREFDSMAQLWNITVLVQRLTSVSVRIIPKVAVPQPQFHDFIRAICRFSPSISALSLSCASSGNLLALLSPEVVDSLAQLPLQYLKLCKNGFNDISIDPRCDSERFALSFPQMECLQIWGYYFTFKDLLFMAKHMPRLRRLSVKLEMDKDWPSKDELFSLALTPSPSQMRFDSQFLHTIPGDWRPTLVTFALQNGIAEEIAAGLHALWPKGVLCGDDEGGLEGQGGKSVKGKKGGKVSFIEDVNAMIRRMHEAGGHDNWSEVMLLKQRRKRVPPWLRGFDV